MDSPQLPQNQYSSALALSNFYSRPAFKVLADVLASYTRRGLYYHRKTINLDGLTFEECSFQNCTFITETGNFTLKNCRIEGPETVFSYKGTALKVAKLYELMNSSIAGKVIFGNIFPQPDRDGRVTIE